jgi:hypothetical protein
VWKVKNDDDQGNAFAATSTMADSSGAAQFKAATKAQYHHGCRGRRAGTASTDATSFPVRCDSGNGDDDYQH